MNPFPKYLLLILSCLLLSCSSPKPLVYQEVRNFRVNSVSLQQATVVVDLQFYNPNRYGVSLKNGDLDAYFNDRLLGKAILDERTTVPARDTFLLPVTLTVDISTIFPNALEILGGREVMVRLEGTVQMGRGGVFIHVPVRYKGMQQVRL